jgi:hypothetical protein
MSAGPSVRSAHCGEAVSAGCTLQMAITQRRYKADGIVLNQSAKKDAQLITRTG